MPRLRTFLINKSDAFLARQVPVSTIAKPMCMNLGLKSQCALPTFLYTILGPRAAFSRASQLSTSESQAYTRYHKPQQAHDGSSTNHNCSSHIFTSNANASKKQESKLWSKQILDQTLKISNQRPVMFRASAELEQESS